jgi:hypothetical protein
LSALVVKPPNFDAKQFFQEDTLPKSSAVKFDALR